MTACTRSISGQSVFQSTPPARGATSGANGVEHRYAISIHAPREGGDPIPYLNQLAYSEFQSTPPARGATLFRW